MKFAISQEQRDFFRKNGWISFVDLIDQKELASLNEGIEAALKLKPVRGKSLLSQGRDLWRKEERVKKVVQSRRLVEFAFEWIQKKPLRLAFDQWIPENSKELNEHSAINQLLGIFFIRLTDGSGAFYLPSTPLPDFEEGPFFMIAYCDKYSQYLYEERDPQVHFLKSLGYVFGDRLSDRLHPILLR